MNTAKVIILRKITQIVQSDRANTKFAVANKKVTLLKWKKMFLCIYCIITDILYFSGI